MKYAPAIAALLFLPVTAQADVRLPHIFSDHMVVQSGQAVPIWGWADPNESVTVRFDKQIKYIRANSKGKWQVSLTPLTADPAPHVLKVSGHNQIEVKDVLVGQVWLASGQSNMEKPLGEQRGQKPTFNAEAEITAADHPQLRLFKVTKTRSPTPADDVDGAWVVCTPSTIDNTHFSAVAYFFGRKLLNTLNQPVGMIDSDWGGTRIEPWTPPQGFAAVPALTDYATAAQTGDKAAGVHPSELYNGMIAPLVPYAIKGVIWYQGEENVLEVDDGDGYAPKMTALIKGWRQAWGQQLPFYYVEIAPFLYHLHYPNEIMTPQSEPRLWEAQTTALSLPDTGMVVITDLVDDLFNIHPRDKKTVGERLANMALSNTYGQSGLATYGPMFRVATFDGDRAIVHFDHAEGLTTRDGKAPSWFSIAGADGVFHPGHAVIEGTQVIVTSPDVAAPQSVRLGWDEAAQPNLVNGAGLPANPFRSDNPLTSASQSPPKEGSL